MMKRIATVVGVLMLQAALVQAEEAKQAVASPVVQAVAKVQTTCPVMGGAVSKKSRYVDKDGQRIYVCCGACVKAVKKDFATYKAKLEKDGVTLDKVPVPEAATPPKQ